MIDFRVSVPHDVDWDSGSLPFGGGLVGLLLLLGGKTTRCVKWTVGRAPAHQVQAKRTHQGRLALYKLRYHCPLTTRTAFSCPVLSARATLTAKKEFPLLNK